MNWFTGHPSNHKREAKGYPYMKRGNSSPKRETV
jgi:hypothetical protein